MQINLICSNQLRKLLTETIESRGLSITPNARLSFVEKGFDLPEQGLAVIFDYQSLDDLSDFLGLLNKKPENIKNIIIGRRQDSETFEIISYEDIMYFEAEGNYVHCITNKDNFRVKNKLYELESTLCEQGFIRISKSLLVNIMNITEIIPWFGSRLLLKLKNKNEVEVSRNYVREFKEFLEI
ncbi:LytTR family DNA-binding domain-containing protein [Sporomusa sp.]|uniref:LytTR family DNA-binding domain-containing protein n=1 Tax=Sporomusa sp. TaxID=2078658 RepID=UPI002C07B675|nr:LytTR family DNA-binding domain-containing protein [Sporomusa sp.]HWR06694.1 LytTR family DNA-binding domain-containing protein [Sporomusa sp.]